MCIKCLVIYDSHCVVQMKNMWNVMFIVYFLQNTCNIERSFACQTISKGFFFFFALIMQSVQVYLRHIVKLAAVNV